MRVHQLLVIAALAAPALAATELKVDVYEGPTECADEDKVKAGSYLEMHYTGTIDESSETGEKGKQFDSSRTRGQTFDFQIGQGMVIKGWVSIECTVHSYLCQYLCTLLYCTVLYCTVL